MIDKLLLSAVLGTVGFNGLFPDSPLPLTLQQKAKQASVSEVCNRKKKQSETVKQLCKRWGVQQNA
jgi:hypothetical protein